LIRIHQFNIRLCYVLAFMGKFDAASAGLQQQNGGTFGEIRVIFNKNSRLNTFQDFTRRQCAGAPSCEGWPVYVLLGYLGIVVS